MLSFKLLQLIPAKIKKELDAEEQKIPQLLERESKNFCVVGLFADPERLSETRKIRANINQSIDLKSYTDVEKINDEQDSNSVDQNDIMELFEGKDTM